MSPYTPDARQRLQRAQRFFARPLSFDMECPHCGDVYSIRMAGARKSHTKDPNWDTLTARFTCTNTACARSYVLGIVAWPIIASPRVASSPPMDQVPSPRQLAQMRKEGGGWWMPEEEGQRYQRPHETNLTTELDRPEDPDED